MWKQSAALLAAIKEYDANKWKAIGQKVGKPAKVGLGVDRHRSASAANVLLPFMACDRLVNTH
jgi:hypothetical protein